MKLSDQKISNILSLLAIVISLFCALYIFHGQIAFDYKKEKDKIKTEVRSALFAEMVRLSNVLSEGKRDKVENIKNPIKEILFINEYVLDMSEDDKLVDQIQIFFQNTFRKAILLYITEVAHKRCSLDFEQTSELFKEGPKSSKKDHELYGTKNCKVELHRDAYRFIETYNDIIIYYTDILKEIGFYQQNFDPPTLERFIHELPYHWPISTREDITAHFGPYVDLFTGLRCSFDNICIRSQKGDHIFSTVNGVVVKTHKDNVEGRYAGRGNALWIQNDFGIIIRFAHLDSFVKQEGDHVKKGDIIGYCGSTGRCTGPHTNYAIKYGNKSFDPYNFLIYTFEEDNKRTRLESFFND